MRTPINIWNVRFLINFGLLSILIIFFLLLLSSSSLANELQLGGISSKSSKQGSLKAQKNLRPAISKGKRLQQEQKDIKNSMHEQKVNNKKAQQKALTSKLEAERVEQMNSLSGALLQPRVRKGVKIRQKPIQKSKQGSRRQKK
jgi:hypothetical protein